MLEQCKALTQQYASKELNMSELKELRSSGLVDFENKGISRSKKECLLCVVTFFGLARLKEELLKTSFDSVQHCTQYLQASGYTFEKEEESDPDYATYTGADGFYEIGCCLNDEGRAVIDVEELKLNEFFNVYLRIQH